MVGWRHAAHTAGYTGHIVQGGGGSRPAFTLQRVIYLFNAKCLPTRFIIIIIIYLPWPARPHSVQRCRGDSW